MTPGGFLKVQIELLNTYPFLPSVQLSFLKSGLMRTKCN